MAYSRRSWMQTVAVGTAGIVAGTEPCFVDAAPSAAAAAPLKITDLVVHADRGFPDPPLLNAGGCHGPYFLRNIVQKLHTDAGVVRNR